MKRLSLTLTASLQRIYGTFGDEVPLVLHGTHPLSDDMVRVAMRDGMRKINQNRNIWNGYHKYMEENGGNGDLTVLQERGVEVYSQGIRRLMVEVFDSAETA